MLNVIKDQTKIIQQWYIDNNLELNYDKTKYQIFHKSSDHIPPEHVNRPLILESGHEIEQVECFKYLGVELDSTLSFKAHYDSVIKRVSSNLGYMYGLKRYLTSKVMLIMLNCHVHSIMDYCLDLWATHTDPQLNNIQKKVDHYLISYYLPVIAKKHRSHKSRYYKDFRHKINVAEIRKKCNLLTLPHTFPYVF